MPQTKLIRSPMETAVMLTNSVMREPKTVRLSRSRRN